MLGLFNSDGTFVTFEDPANGGAETEARFFDIDPVADHNDTFTLTLEGGDYLLALIVGSTLIDIDGSLFTVGVNNFHESLLSGFDCDDAELCGSFGLLGQDFAFNMEVPDGAPVPEPGTLTLMAGGAIAGLIQRRRSKKRNQSESVSR
jgi:hypothetical protein